MSPVPPLVVVGNPDNRRVAMFRAAAHDWPGGVEVVPWRRLSVGRVRLPDGAVVRVDSPGEDAEVDRRLRGAATPAEPGEIIGLAAWYRGFGTALVRLADAVREAGATLLNDPYDILVMFDKRACHTRLSRAGIPVPDALPGGPRDYGELRDAMRTAGWSRVFVKPAHGSSASGVLALQVASGRVLATSSVESGDDGRLFNSLRVRSRRDEAEIATIVDRLAPDGLHVERWFPKVGLAGRVIDLRVLVVAGRPTHVVVRASRSPLTNLHLGNARGDLAAVRAAMGHQAYEEALRTCVRAADCFPRTLHAGVDLLVGTDWRRHAVAEVNAFGDLLPNLLDGRGRDSYAAQLDALREGWLPTGPATGVDPGPELGLTSAMDGQPVGGHPPSVVDDQAAEARPPSNTDERTGEWAEWVA